MAQPFLLALLLAAAAPGSAAETPPAAAPAPSTAAVPAAPSTATARTRGEGASPFNVSFWYDERGTRVNLDYRLRWDFSDVRRLPGASMDALRSPIASLETLTWDLTRGASIGVYGVRIRPARMLVRQGPPAGTPGAGTVGAGVEADPSPWSSRFKLSLTPVIQDIRRDLRSTIRRQLVTSGVDAALPQARGASRAQKEALADDAFHAGESMGLDPDRLQSDILDDINEELGPGR
ncbi:MAG: hypothetical protein A2X36_12770 [Elusimicrobia bacterium GWA2_69_24]|nr:MAG: hypothetical protein A2X36_12770 [Elusimicrobia bacterium GWA2_69_24]